MAKSKRRKPRKKTLGRSSTFFRTLKQMVIGSCIVVACFIGLLYIYNYFYPATDKQPVEKDREEHAEIPKTTIPRKTTPKKPALSVPSPASTRTFKIPVHTEIPKLQAKRQEQIIKHEGYTVSYNSDYRIANWVAYELTAEEAKSKKAERSNKFVSDPDVKGATATNEDYTRTGYDRGHLAPAGDMKWSTKAMRESFYLSNICPQEPDLNRGIWKELEEQCRLWAMDNGSLLIVTGPVITENMKRLGKNQVAVPKSFYKVLCYNTGGNYTGIAFLFDNKDYKKRSLSSMAIPIDSIEEVTGIDFFPTLPDDIEKEMETSIDFSNWSF